MDGYTITSLADVPDMLGDYPGEMRMATYSVGAEQAALTWRRMPAQTGGKGSYGHRHRTQEELYLVLSGTLQFKLDDEGSTCRPAPWCASRRRWCGRSGTTVRTTSSW
jgi:hypothetical protein